MIKYGGKLGFKIPAAWFFPFRETLVHNAHWCVLSILIFIMFQQKPLELSLQTENQRFLELKPSSDGEKKHEI